MNAKGPAGLAVNVVELNPYTPQPYVFSEAALCLRDSIRAAGYGSQLSVNEADLQALNIVFGAPASLQKALAEFDPAKTVIFNFEQLASNSILLSPEYLEWVRGWTVADYHSRNVDYLKQRNGPGQRVFELPLVPSLTLRAEPERAAAKTVDVLFYGTLSERRSRTIARLQAAGLDVEVVAGAYGKELAPAIARSRMVLHVHFYDTGLFPIARMLQPVANGVPVVCESSVFSAAGDWSGSGIVFAEYEGIVDACLKLLRSPAEQARCAERALRFAAQFDFTTPFNRLLAAQLRVLADRRTARLQSSISMPGDAASRPEAEGAGELSNAEIEAILANEASELPPEAHLLGRPIPVVERQLGHGRFGRWAVWLLLLFSLVTIWQQLR